MTGILKPILSILPEPQLKLWEELSETPNDFILYGGTAIALRLGHRTSIDFDFFSPLPFDPEQLYRKISYLKNSRIVQQTKNTLTCSIDRDGEILVFFFGDLSIGQVKCPSISEKNHLHIASLEDLSGTKAAVIQKRVELKDYLDIDALLTFGNLKLDFILACGEAVYKKAFNPLITLKALCYFNDQELQPLSPAIREKLKNAVENVDLENLPKLESFPLGTE